MSPIYELIGRLVVLFIRLRFRRQLRVAAAVAVAGAIAAGYAIATRDVEEA